jgi:hypothetical protein
MSWIIWLILSRGRNVREFADHGRLIKIIGPSSGNSSESSSMDVDDDPTVIGHFISSSLADRCTINLCSSLEDIGLWKWACFVVLFLTRQSSIEKMLKMILSKWYPYADVSGSIVSENQSVSEDWSFVVDQLKVPASWVHESKVIAGCFFVIF